MKFQYLITTCKKDTKRVLDIIEKSNLSGNVLVGNQLCTEESTEQISTDKCDVTIFNITSRGLSRNRNFLLSKSSADYIMFVDDDISFVDGEQSLAEEYVEASKKECVRFNLKGESKNRIFKQKDKFTYLRFKDLTSLGINGIYFERDVLNLRKILFDENVGTGAPINHGEDSLFFKEFLKKNKIYQNPKTLIILRDEDSTWLGKTRDLEVELVSHGYLYRALFGFLAYPRSVLFLLTHMRCYPKGTKIHTLQKYMNKGMKLYKKSKKGDAQ